ncbi:hypothetical protein [Sphingobacterium multivorum]|uniref:hypothetical protein n=1 Tax=Sphingobacterium multivorum TaxID=28454 RepID=UPI0028A117A0|nr:hypothetical protein [Sphingobacterium multivorum]
MIIDVKEDVNRLFFNVAPFTIEGIVKLKLTKESSNKEIEFDLTPEIITDRFIKVLNSFNNLELGKYRYELDNNSIKIDSGFITVIGESKKVAKERATEVRKVIDGRKK